MTPQQALRHHVTGAIERGEATAIVAQHPHPTTQEDTLTPYPIGQQYLTRGKAPRLCTVTDIYRTYNHTGDLVRVRYVSTHRFLGQTITDHDVATATIARGIDHARLTA